MPFIPHTQQDIDQMLSVIGVDSIDALFDEIPGELQTGIDGVPEGLGEMAVTRLMEERAARDPRDLCFIGAGAYDHHIPAAVWQITTRGEYYSAYTPYQAEASQGNLQLIYEYQTMMAGLTGMEVSNASMYDGASALGEAALMAVRANRRSRSRRILMPTTVNPLYRRTAEVIVGNQGITFEPLDYDPATGTIDSGSLPTDPGDVAALVIPQPNFFGALEDVDALTDWAHDQGALVIAVVNPTAMAVLSAPGSWGAEGADIVCGEGQPLGIPLSSGGPYYGFMCCRKSHLRQLPGRLVARAVDADGRDGYTLTLQAREQHIRRSKATSNICTNQGLMVTASTIYMALLGADGLAAVAGRSHANTRALVEKLTALPGVERAFGGAYFHEAVLRLPRPAGEVLEALAERGILGGCRLAGDYPELGEALLVSATERRTGADLDRYAAALAEVLA
ncbi:MAG TPA: aminomethyl-transferring glycine dehydrogenase subunit GcvPA [Gammaproteobacteria bacterium]|nr:aminomethyl-transferring glycine dehydrogenase subunit GcvPA [Gammaproteobacteria bacterium]